MRVVHDVACELVAWVRTNYAAVAVNPDAVLFGAATHDIGKVIHPEELSAPGSAHEQDGYRLLLEHGVGAELARFARTHASWSEVGVGVDDLLVSLADKIWKGKRVPELEQLIVQRLAAADGSEPWQAFMVLDDELTRIAAAADRRLAFQANYPTTT
ncbi:HD domain-containing protein [Nocardia iowensis]